MKKIIILSILAVLSIPGADRALSIARPEVVYKVFQFPKNAIPRIDGQFSDWDMVPDSYIIGTSEMRESYARVGERLDLATFDLKVKVGWVNGDSRLYFYVEAYDDYWDFTDPVMATDMFELVVDGNLSGGMFIKENNDNINILPVHNLHFKGHGAHAQNYHIFMPVPRWKDWAMIWGAAQWLKEFPYANIAYDYDIKQGESGVVRMEFWVTAFDHADFEGPERSVASRLVENDLTGISWCILDFDGPGKPAARNGVYSLSHDFEMIRNGSALNAFRLMPLENGTKPKALWTSREIDRDQRLIQFIDQSVGNVEKYTWNFGDGGTSNERYPIHRYEKAGEWTVSLTVEGPDGEDKFLRVWNVVTK